jgi:hypothetical protein
MQLRAKGYTKETLGSYKNPLLKKELNSYKNLGGRKLPVRIRGRNGNIKAIHKNNNPGFSGKFKDGLYIITGRKLVDNLITARATGLSVRDHIEEHGAIGLATKTMKITCRPWTDNPLSISPRTHNPLSVSPWTDNSLSISPRTHNPLSISPRTHNPLSISPRTHNPLSISPRTHNPLSISPRTDDSLYVSPWTYNPLYEPLWVYNPAYEPKSQDSSENSGTK